jgi:glycosyltransferase involved in cell wall biosynthesis
VADLISVITVNLDDAAGLRATAESMAFQERPPEQWIVVDGGSTDGSIEVIRQFEHLIHHWTSAPDRGVYDAMNQGLRSAQGRYVIFMNAGGRFAAPDSLATGGGRTARVTGRGSAVRRHHSRFPLRQNVVLAAPPDCASALRSAGLPSGHGDPPRRPPAGAL